jgi:hypothetical protein
VAHTCNASYSGGRDQEDLCVTEDVLKSKGKSRCSPRKDSLVPGPTTTPCSKGQSILTKTHKAVVGTLTSLPETGWVSILSWGTGKEETERLLRNNTKVDIVRTTQDQCSPSYHKDFKIIFA